MARVSFEFFPGKDEASQNALMEAVNALSAHQPEYQTVTFGAGGSTQEGTFESVCLLSQKSGRPTASHLTYAGLNKDDIKQYSDRLWEKGCRRIIALRGDAQPIKDKEQAFGSTADFVSSLVERHPFEVGVACYPEVHPKATSFADDLAVLKAKQDAGAGFAITQFFFDNSVFYDFVASARLAGITVPIIPGILPIYNLKSVQNFASKCGADVPEFVVQAFEKAKQAGNDAMEVSSILLEAQVRDLAYNGYEDIHIYTLNRAELASLAVNAFEEAHEERGKMSDLSAA